MSGSRWLLVLSVTCLTGCGLRDRWLTRRHGAQVSGPMLFAPGQATSAPPATAPSGTGYPIVQETPLQFPSQTPVITYGNSPTTGQRRGPLRKLLGRRDDAAATMMTEESSNWPNHLPTPDSFLPPSGRVTVPPVATGRAQRGSTYDYRPASSAAASGGWSNFDTAPPPHGVLPGSSRQNQTRLEPVPNSPKPARSPYLSDPFGESARGYDPALSQSRRNEFAGDETDSVRQLAAYASARPDALVGQIVDSTGRPQSGATVVAVAHGSPSGGSLESVADARGRFEIRGLTPGRRYLVLATVQTEDDPLLGRVSITTPHPEVTIAVARAFTRPASGVADRDVSPARKQPSLSTDRSGSSGKPSASSGGVPSLPWVPLGSNATQSERSPSESRWSPAAEERQPIIAAAPPVRTAIPVRRNEGPAFDPGESALVARLREGGSSIRMPPESETRKAPEARETQERREPVQLAANLPRTKDLPRVAAAAPSQHRSATPYCRFEAGRLVDFELSDLQSRGVRFSELGGELVLLDFWGTWCGPCLRSIPKLNEIHDRYSGAGLRVVGIAYEQDETAAERLRRVQAIRSQLNMRYTVLLGDESGQCPLSDQMRVGVYPTMVLLDHTGRELWRAEGANPRELQRLEAILQKQLMRPAPGTAQ